VLSVHERHTRLSGDAHNAIGVTHEWREHIVVLVPCQKSNGEHHAREAHWACGCACHELDFSRLREVDAHPLLALKVVPT
jgi:hypothetical protein